MRKNEKTFKKEWILILLLLLFIFVFLFSFFLGKYPIELKDFFRVILSRFIVLEPNWNPQIETILFNIRFPRILMAAIIGAGISVAGATYQALFQNPMVSQDVLGASQGSAFGAAIGLFLSVRYEAVIASSFLFGLIAVAFVLMINKFIGTRTLLNMILIGMMTGSLFSSGVSFLKLVGDPTNTLPAITYWLMGSLSSIKMQDVYFAAPFILIGLVPIFLLRWRLNVISLGEEEASSIGVHVGRLRFVMIIAATLITAAAVSVSGLISWVGLVVPHFARIIIGNDYRYSIPATALLGGSFLVVVDNFSRMLTTSEIPIGILTSFIGAPIFILLIAQNNRKAMY